MRNIVIRGSGGNAREIAFLIERINSKQPQWNLMGYIDIQDVGEIKYGYPVIGDESWFSAHPGICCVIAMGDPFVKFKVYKDLQRYELEFPNLIDPNAIIAKDVQMGIGNIMTGPGKLSVTSKVGNFCLFVGNCAIGHDVNVGSFVSVMNYASILGWASIGDRALIGTNSVVLQKVAIGNGATIGAGAVVLKNVKDNITVFGAPARMVSERNEIIQ